MPAPSGGLVRQRNKVGLAFASHSGYAVEEIPQHPEHLIAWKSL
jgi:hypothetical protein